MDLKAQDISLENSEEFEMESLNFPRKRRLLKKAPEAPKRFKSAYICFVMDKMERVKESLPSEIKVKNYIMVFCCVLIFSIAGDRYYEGTSHHVEEFATSGEKGVRR